MKNQELTSERIKALAAERITDRFTDDPMGTWEILTSLHSAFCERMGHSTSEKDGDILYFLLRLIENTSLLVFVEAYSEKDQEGYSERLIKKLDVLTNLRKDS